MLWRQPFNRCSSPEELVGSVGEGVVVGDGILPVGIVPVGTGTVPVGGGDMLE